MHNALQTLSPLVIVRVVLVIFAFLFLIGFKRRKRLVAVQSAGATVFAEEARNLIASDLSENRLQLVVFGFFTAVALAYVVYTMYVPSAAAF
jgi:Mg2+/citrate symporter